MNNDDIFRSLRVGTPCHMKFDELEGDGSKRWCGECRLHVYDFAQLTRGEVTDLVTTAEGRLCGRVVRREDGTMLTKDCGPVRRRKYRLSAAAAALLVTLAPFGLTACARGTVEGAGTEPPDVTPSQVDPGPELPELLGEVCVPEEATLPGEFEELGDVVFEPAELVPALSVIEHDPREMLGRIALPPRKPVEKPEPTERQD